MPGVERQNLVVKASPAGLVLGDQFAARRCRGGRGDLNRQFAELAFQGLLALAIAGVASGILYGTVLVVAR